MAKSVKAVVSAMRLLLLFAVMFCGPTNAFSANNVLASDAPIPEEQTFWQANLDEDFDDDCVLIVMDRRIGGVNKIYDENYFGNFQKKSITDLTLITGDLESKKYLDIENFHQILKIELQEKSKENVLNVIRQIEKVEGVLWVGPNHYDSPALQPNAASGTRYSQLWGMHGTNGISAENAWNITTGNNTVRVGVIDSGIANHADLNANIVAGWDFFNNNAVTNDDTTSGHGTHVAGIIGATGANTNGVAGVCWNVSLVPMQVFDPAANDWPIATVTAAITWAINQNDIPILNYSGGGTNDNVARRAAIGNYIGLFVCAAGNNDNNNDITRYYPSDYSRGQTFSNRVISVGAIMVNGNRPTVANWGWADPPTNTIPRGSNFGSASVSIFAPGDGILSTVPTAINSSGYASWSGTSMATPHVTGVAALLLSNNPSLTPANIKQIFLDRGTLNSNLTGLCVSGRQLNAYAALCGSFVTVVNDSYISSNGTGPYSSGSKVYLNAGSRYGYAFNNWTVNSGGVTLANQSSAQTTFTMPANTNVTVTANWTPIPTYSVSVSGSNANPNGAGAYTANSLVYIYAGTAPQQGYVFTGWTVNYGNINLYDSGSTTAYFNMPSNAVSVTANWAQGYSVTVNGSYHISPGSGSYAAGTKVYIYAGGLLGYDFAGWSVNSGGVTLDNLNSTFTYFTMPSTAVSVTANWTVSGSPSWITYAESTFHPYDNGSLYRVPYELRYYKGGSGYQHYTYAYFDDLGDATQFADSWWQFQEEYIGPYDGGYLYYQVTDWTLEYYDNGNWYIFWKK